MFKSRVCQVLQAEHEATLELLERLGGLLAKHRQSPPSATDPLMQRLLRELPAAIEGELARHFEFEESGLFPVLEEVGEAELGEHLTSEHVILRPYLEQLVKAAKEAERSGFDAARWEAFRNAGEQIVPLLSEHAKKEDLMLLPLLEEQLDEQADLELYESYVAQA